MKRASAAPAMLPRPGSRHEPSAEGGQQVAVQGEQPGSGGDFGRSADATRVKARGGRKVGRVA